MEGSSSLIDLFHEVLGANPPLQLPPSVFEELQLSFKKYESQKFLICTFPAQARFANAIGMYQNGMIGAAFDAVFVSLATLIAKRACTTVTLEQQFTRTLPADGTSFSVEARMRAVKSSFVFLEASAKDRNGKLFATATSTLAPYRASKSEVDF